MRKHLVLIPMLVCALFMSAGAAEASAPHLTFDGQAYRVKSGSGNLGQQWRPSNVTVTGGVLNIYNRNRTAGGVGMLLNKHLGTYAITFRMSAGIGKYAILLWPSGSNRPEVDLAENSKNDPGRTRTMATYHPKPGCNSCIQSRVSGDFTNWHTVTGNWTNSGFTVSLDGKQFANYPHPYGGQMHLSIQTNALNEAGTSVLQVSKVAVS